MDLNNFKEVKDTEADDLTSVKQDIGSNDPDQLIRELEERISKIDSENPTLKEGSREETHTIDEIHESQAESEEILEEEREKTFLEKIQPFILPICLTLFALIFSAVFMYFFAKSRTQPTLQAITNQNSQPEVIIIKEPKPQVKEEPIVTEEEPIVETPVVATPTKAVLAEGGKAILKLRFSYDKFSYDNTPRGIFLLKDQPFQGDYEDFKLIATNRAYANDFFFGIDRYMVSLIGSCSYVVDEAEVEVTDIHSGENDKPLASVGNNYLVGRVVKIVDASKPHIVCDKR